MKKTAIALAMGAAMVGTGVAQAAFLQAGSTGTIDFTGGCFTFGDCAIGGTGNVTDNGIAVRGNGSAVAGDGLVGQIGFTVGGDGNSLTITSYQQDTYTGTAGGDFALEGDLSQMSGYVSDTGEVTLTLSRTGFPAYFSYLDGSLWNIDDAAAISGQGDAVTGTWDVLTTGSDSAWTPGSPGTPTLANSGTALTGGAGTWTGTVINAGNVGADWGAFDGTPYTEKFNITLNGVEAEVIPVPAAMWLLGSGLVGLVGVARRKSKQA